VLLVVPRSLGNRHGDLAPLGTQICMRFASINILISWSLPRCIAIAVAANVLATSMFADLPSILASADD
jgi:hypothetical protein